MSILSKSQLAQPVDANNRPRVLVFADQESFLGQKVLSTLEWLREQDKLDLHIPPCRKLEGIATDWCLRSIQDITPTVVIISRRLLTIDRIIAAFCRDRGITIICSPTEVFSASYNNLRESYEGHVLKNCDAIYAATPKLANMMRKSFPNQKVVDWVAEINSAQNAMQLLTTLVGKTPKINNHKLLHMWRQLLVTATNFARQSIRHLIRPIEREGSPASAQLRILFVSNSFLPTIQISFLRPLQPLVAGGQVAWEVLSDMQLPRLRRALSMGGTRWAHRRIKRFQPQLIVFCRYSGAYAKSLIDWANSHEVPTIYYLDDDLLNVPIEIGANKYAFHNQPTRLKAVRYLLRTTNTVYCSTQPLLQRVRKHGISGRSVAAKVHCPGEILSNAPTNEPLRIGYMGIDHSHDFRVALPGLLRLLERNPHIHFELFGPIEKPVELDQFGDRIVQIPFVDSYEDFLGTLASRSWAIGICPLADTPFNRMKSNNKWVEYTSVGAVTVATAGTIYDECCAENCGILVNENSEWDMALQPLIDNRQRRLEIVRLAQERLRREYSLEARCHELQELFRDAQEMSRSKEGIQSQVTIDADYGH